MMFLSCKLYFFNTVWHCFNEPHGSPVRYSYMISCLIILFAYRFFTAATESGIVSCADSDSYDRGHIQAPASDILSMIFCGILFALISVWTYKQYYEYLTKIKWLLTLTAFAGCLGLLLLHAALTYKQLLPRLRKCLLPMLGILCCLELTANACLTYRVFPFRNIDYQLSYTTQYEPAVTYVKNSDSGLYRMEKTTSVTTNDPMLFNYYGISHDSSFHKFTLQEFCDNLGLTSHGSIIHYDTNASLSTDSLLGIKYLLSETAPNSIYKPVHTTAEGVTVYENPYALPLLYLADAVSFDTVPEDNQPFAYQNMIFSALTGHDAPVFKPCDAVVTAVENLTEEFVDNGTLYSLQNTEEPSCIEFTVTAQNTEPMYAFFQSEVPYARLYVNGEEVTSLNSNSFDLYFNGLLSLGAHQPDEAIVIRIEPETEPFLLALPEFYYQDTTVLSEDYNILTANTPEIRQISGSRFEAQISVPQRIR